MYSTYSMQRSINFSYIDNRGISRPSALFDLMQDIATDHAYALHLDKDTLHIFWVLSRMQIHQVRPFVPCEIIHFSTMLSGCKGVTWYRSFSFTDEKGQTVAQGASSWVMLDPQSHRILRPKDMPAAAEYVVPPPEDFIVPNKLTHQANVAHHVHTVRYSDLDVNCHLNNVKTVDLIADTLELDRRDGLFVSDMQVNYTAQCLQGEQITLFHDSTADGVEYICGKTQEGTKFEASVVLSPYKR